MPNKLLKYAAKSAAGQLLAGFAKDTRNCLLQCVRRQEALMMFTVSHVEKTRESFGEYRYGIYENGKIIAYFWHDYRGDDNGIEFVDGISVHDPVGTRANFLEGGGPQPLKLSKKAVQYINENRP